MVRIIDGGMPERPIGHDLKSCVGQPTVGSNPTPSAERLVAYTLALHRNS